MANKATSDTIERAAWPGMGGGKSSKTLAALNALAMAMIEDNPVDTSRAADR